MADPRSRTLSMMAGLMAGALCAAAVLMPAPAGATQRSAERVKPVTQDNPDAKAVAETPLTDLNVKKGEIPPVLLRAQRAPYSLAGLKSCPAIIREVGQLNSALGDDVDLAKGGKRNTSAGHVAQSVVGSLIPFQGVIREVSGASAEQRRLEAVIRAGMARRGFLKGVGLSRGCHAPARPA